LTPSSRWRPARSAICRRNSERNPQSKLARGAVRHLATDRLVVVGAVEDEAVPAFGDDVEDIGRPDLEVLRVSKAKNCGLLIEIGARMDEIFENCRKVFEYPISAAVHN
jgi:hypothetical protein